MSDIILFIIVVLVVLVLALYAVSLLPLVAPAFVKPLLMFLCVVFAACAIARKARWL